MINATSTATESTLPRPAGGNHPSPSTLRALDWLNFFLADVQSGVGPFLAIYLASNRWNEQSVGVALTVGGLAGIIANTPAGALVDRLRSKRAMIALGVFALSAGSLAIALHPSYASVMTSQILIGAASAVFAPVITAISLGIVGHKLFDRRQGRNQAFNSAGNVVAAILIGLIGFYISNRAIFFFVLALSIPTLLALSFIRPTEIDYDLARNLKDHKTDGPPAKVWDLLKNRPLLIFLVCAVLFHFANAAMLPLLGEDISRGKGRSSMAFMAACVITTQLVIALFANWTGRKAAAMGKKAPASGWFCCPSHPRHPLRPRPQRPASHLHPDSRRHRSLCLRCRFRPRHRRSHPRHRPIQSRPGRHRHRRRHRRLPQPGDRRRDCPPRRLFHRLSLPLCHCGRGIGHTLVSDARDFRTKFGAITFNSAMPRPNRIILDPAAPEDSTPLAALHTAVAAHLTQVHGQGPWSAPTSEKNILFAMRNGHVLIARDRTKIIATLRLNAKKPWAIDKSYFAKSRNPLYLLAMAVAPEHQRQGIGRQCLEEAARIARTLSADAIRLDAYDANAGAGKFYARCGYTEVGRATYRNAPLIYYELLLS